MKEKVCVCRCVCLSFRWCHHQSDHRD